MNATHTNLIPTDRRMIRECDLAEMLGVHVQTMRRWRGEGSAPKATRIGRFWLYQLRDVAAWQDERSGGDR